LSGVQLTMEGVPVRLETSGTSEMLLFESSAITTKNR
jgi:hypothetical protein